MRTKTHLLDLTFRGTESGGHSGTQEIYDCPFCGSEGRFSVDRVLMVGKCWHTGCEVCVRITDGTETERTPLPPPEVKRAPRPCTLPPWIELTDRALEYLRSDKRGLTPHGGVARLRYSLKETNTGGQLTKAGDPWDGRIIIPIFQDNQLFSFVACDYEGGAKKKVLSGPNGAGEGALFYAAPWEGDGRDDYTIAPYLPSGLATLNVVEGCWDAMKVGVNTPTVAILGTGGKHGLSDAQVARILQATHPGTHINVMLDPDAKAKALKVAAQLRSVRPLTRNLTLLLPADPCDTSYELLKELQRR